MGNGKEFSEAMSENGSIQLSSQNDYISPSPMLASKSFSFSRSSGVVRNYQAKLIRDFLPFGVVQKQMKSPMNGFVLHENNYRRNQFSTKKTPSIAAKPYFSSRAYCKLKTSVAASRNIA